MKLPSASLFLKQDRGNKKKNGSLKSDLPVEAVDASRSSIYF